MENFFSTDFICRFQMGLYPFDTQKCRANFFLNGNDQFLVDLQSGTLRYEGPNDVNEYVIIDVTMGRNLVIKM